MQMQLDQNPFFRKPITPWYDSIFACRLLIACMFLVFAFAVGGVIVAAGDPRFEPHIWFPGILAFISAFLGVKVYFRLRLRSKNS